MNFKSQLGHFSFYAFTIFFNAAISFITFSFLTQRLSEVDYGIINLYNAVIVFLTPFIAFGTQFVLGVDFLNSLPMRFGNSFLMHF